MTFSPLLQIKFRLSGSYSLGAAVVEDLFPVEFFSVETQVPVETQLLETQLLETQSLETQSLETQAQALEILPVEDALAQREVSQAPIQKQRWQRWNLLFSASFLVSVPVFLEAPLVRTYPWIALALTPFLAVLSWSLEHRPTSSKWGDLLWGFTLTWLAGAIYWGWFRWEPLIHLPIEALGFPLVIWSLRRDRWLIGCYFYLGSLLGTAITDAYFYLVDLIPYWRSVMRVDLDLGSTVLQAALGQMQTSWGIGCAIALILSLIAMGGAPFTNSQIRSGVITQIHWWAFSGAILCTLVVDGFFWLLSGRLPA